MTATARKTAQSPAATDGNALARPAVPAFRAFLMYTALTALMTLMGCFGFLAADRGDVLVSLVRFTEGQYW